MKVRPIIFSTPMVQAIRALRKTETRRISGLKKLNENPDGYYFQSLVFHHTGKYTFAPHKDGQPIAGDIIEVKCPYGRPIDILWVRETHSIYRSAGRIQREKTKFRADNRWKDNNLVKWKPSIHMPREIARTWLMVQQVKIQRLHDITTDEIKAEGVWIPMLSGGRVAWELGKDNSAISFLPEGSLTSGGIELTDKDVFRAFWAELWCSINGRASWEANPWVWAVKFHVVSLTGMEQELMEISKEK